MIYFNEIDKFASGWLSRIYPSAHVDKRSITDVTAEDVHGFEQVHLFGGIGGWPLALQLAGWPADRQVWTGSCPCQPFSTAGKRKGKEDPRHLWPEMLRLITLCRPATVFGEQVASKDGLAWLDVVQSDMEAAGYAFGALDLSAAGFGAPHIRQRTFFVADANHERRTGQHALLRKAAGGRDTPALLETAGRSGIDGLAYTDCGSGGQGRSLGRRRNSRSNAQQGAGFSGHVSVERLADADGRNAGAERQQRSGQHGQFSPDGELVCLADADGAGSQGRRGGWNGGDERAARTSSLGSESGSTGPTNGFWRDADWLRCRDERWRPVEPGTFPLVNGAPARVGRLRGYGNAIVAPVAEAFIRAAMTVLDDTRR